MILLLTAALAAEPDPGVRDAHTVALGAGALPACRAEDGVSPCKSVLSGRAHGDHRLGRGVMVAWDLIGERRGWYASDRGEVHATWRLDAAVGVGWHREWTWGDMRLWAGPSYEASLVEGSALGDGTLPDAVGVPWLDPVAADGRRGSWDDVGLVVGNDIDAPVGPVRLGFRWRFRIGADLPPRGLEPALTQDPSPGEITAGLDIWELHGLTLVGPWKGPVGAMLEVGWTNQFTVPFRQDPQFRVAPWILVGIEVRGGEVRPPAG